MYTLRTKTKQGLEINSFLGEEFVLIHSTHENFENYVGTWKPEDKEGIYGIVVFRDGTKVHPLYEDNRYYIVNAVGTTYANISESSNTWKS